MASRSYTPTPAAPDGEATISVTPTVPWVPIAAPMLRMGRNLGGNITASDNDTRIAVTVGARAVGDSDRPSFRIFSQNPDGSLALRNTINGSNYTWKQ
ncbi:hypothetical protein D3C87_1554450 [compost metagenome]